MQRTCTEILLEFEEDLDAKQTPFVLCHFASLYKQTHFNLLSTSKQKKPATIDHTYSPMDRCSSLR